MGVEAHHNVTINALLSRPSALWRDIILETAYERKCMMGTSRSIGKGL
jgi:hypothetical protein